MVIAMRRGLFGLSAVLLAVVALAAACNDGDESTGSTPQATDTPAATPTAATPDAGDVSTPAPTPAEDSTPTAAEASPTVEVTPVPGARLATIPENVIGFLSGYDEKIPERVPCGGYDEERAIVDCTEAGFGLIQLSPPLVEGTNITCVALLIDGEIIGANCNSTDPIFGTIYELQ